MFEHIKSRYTWCLHCEQAFPTKNLTIEEHGWQECPNCSAGCMDLLPWTKRYAPRALWPEYPVVPEAGKVYPLYVPKQTKV